VGAEEALLIRPQLRKSIHLMGMNVHAESEGSSYGFCVVFAAGSAHLFHCNPPVEVLIQHKEGPEVREVNRNILPKQQTIQLRFGPLWWGGNLRVGKQRSGSSLWWLQHQHFIEYQVISIDSIIRFVPHAGVLHAESASGGQRCQKNAQQEYHFTSS